MSATDQPPDLLLLRHGKSSWQSAARDDFDRPLSPRGKRDAPRMGQWLLSHGLVPDFVVSSPAKRARQTVRRVARALGISRDVVEFDDRLYDGDLGALLEVIEDRPAETRCLLVVGHNPSLEDLVRQSAPNSLSLKDADSGTKLFPTAALAHIRNGELLEITRPRTLERSPEK